MFTIKVFLIYVYKLLNRKKVKPTQEVTSLCVNCVITPKHFNFCKNTLK